MPDSPKIIITAGAVATSTAFGGILINLIFLELS